MNHEDKQFGAQVLDMALRTPGARSHTDVIGVAGAYYQHITGTIAPRATQEPEADAAWPEHLRRVFNEKRELDECISKLQAFLGTEAFGGVDSAEQARLQKQILAMQTYSDILKERLAAFAPA